MKVWIDRNELWPVFSIGNDEWGDEIEMEEKDYLRLKESQRIAQQNWAAIQKELEEIWLKSKEK